MSEHRGRNKACKRIIKYVEEAMISLKKAEGENTKWQFVPDEVFEEMISVLGNIKKEVAGGEA